MKKIKEGTRTGWPLRIRPVLPAWMVWKRPSNKMHFKQRYRLTHQQGKDDANMSSLILEADT